MIKHTKGSLTVNVFYAVSKSEVLAPFTLLNQL